MNTFSELQSREIESARAKHKPINSAHEGYSVILEELDEFWEEVRKKHSLRDKNKMVAELVQIAAMAQRTAEDVCMEQSPNDQAEARRRKPKRMNTETTLEPPAIPPLPPAAGSSEMLELPNCTKIRFCNAFDQIKAHCILCKPCDIYLRWGDGDLCSTGKAMIALEMCYTDTIVKL